MKIIAVDDERMALESLVAAIKKVVPDGDIQGFRRTEEALEYARKNPCDIAFLDIQMRMGNGMELARKLKLIYPKINIIFTTGYSEYAGEAFSLHVSGYVMKPVTPEKIQAELKELRHPVVPEGKKRMRIRTFGNFEVFADGQPLKFQYSKSKEMLAYLVDRRGAMCSNGELVNILWDEEDTTDHSSYLKAIKSDLTSALEKAGCKDVLVRQRGKTGILPEKIDCDYFDWIEGRAYALNEYQGEYMAQYSWSEFTHGNLDDTWIETGKRDGEQERRKKHW